MISRLPARFADPCGLRPTARVPPGQGAGRVAFFEQENQRRSPCKLKLRDPVGFATQGLRRKNCLEMEQREVTTASVAMRVLQCKMFVNSKTNCSMMTRMTLTTPQSLGCSVKAMEALLRKSLANNEVSSLHVTLLPSWFLLQHVS